MSKKLTLKDFKITDAQRKYKRAIEKTFSYSLKNNKTFSVDEVKYLYNEVVNDLKKNKLTD